MVLHASIIVLFDNALTFFNIAAMIVLCGFLETGDLIGSADFFERPGDRSYYNRRNDKVRPQPHATTNRGVSFSGLLLNQQCAKCPGEA